MSRLLLIPGMALPLVGQQCEFECYDGDGGCEEYVHRGLVTAVITDNRNTAPMVYLSIDTLYDGSTVLEIRSNPKPESQWSYWTAHCRSAAGGQHIRHGSLKLDIQPPAAPPEKRRGFWHRFWNP